MLSVPIFRPSFGNRPDRIVGRDDVFRIGANGLASYPGSRERSVLITGQRGMGKTALLLEMADAATEAGFVPARVTCRSAMLDDIIDAGVIASPRRGELAFVIPQLVAYLQRGGGV